MKICFAFILFCLFSFYACDHPEENITPEEKYVEFYNVQEVDLDLDGSHHPQFDHRIVTDAVKREKASLVAVLVYHGIPLRYTPEGRITIPESQAHDQAFLYNLVLMAKDTAWCRHHLMPGLAK